MAGGTKKELIDLLVREVIETAKEEARRAKTRRASEMARSRAEGAELALQALRAWKILPDEERSGEVGSFYRCPHTGNLEAVTEEGAITVRNERDGVSLHGINPLAILPQVSNVIKVVIVKRSPSGDPVVPTKPEAKPKKRAKG